MGKNRNRIIKAAKMIQKTNGDNISVIITGEPKQVLIALCKFGKQFMTKEEAIDVLLKDKGDVK